MGIALTLTLYPLLLAMYLYRILWSLILATWLLIYEKSWHTYRRNDWGNSKWGDRNHDIESSPGDVEGVADCNGNHPCNETRDEVFKFLIREHY